MREAVVCGQHVRNHYPAAIVASFESDIASTMPPIPAIKTVAVNPNLT